MNPAVSNRKILWVDDDENVLASVRRLLRGTPWDLTTEISPGRALDLIRNDEFAVIISDQRMPEISGIDLLKDVRQISPVSTRMMVTAFIDDRLVEEAVNEAAVFRFINKPWDSNEILHDVANAVTHYEHNIEQRKLLREVTLKKRQLEDLTSSLGRLVEERTRPAEVSRVEAERKRRITRELIHFVKELSRAQDPQELMIILRKELRGSRHLMDPILGYMSTTHSPTLLFFRGGHNLAEKNAKQLWPAREGIAFNEKEVRQYLADELGRPVGKVLTVSLTFGGRDGEGAVLFIEHDIPESEHEQWEIWVRERLQPLSLAVDRVLAASENRQIAVQWEKTFDLIGVPVAIVDVDYNLVRGNRPFSERERIDRCYDIFAGLNEPCVGCPVQEAISQGVPVAGEIRRGARLFQVYSFPIRWAQDGAATTAVNSYVDITESRELWSRILQSEKMAALGHLAENIAHELNNPLTGIRSLAQIVRSKLERGSPIDKDFAEVENGAERCQKIIKNFVEFSKGGGEDQLVSVSDLVSRTLPFLKSAMRNHRTNISLSQAADNVRVNPQLFQQVIFNLINNACQAMPEDGELTVKVATSGGKVELQISDTGMGIDPEIRARIFEPFFTTKGSGKGTGLGLSMSQSIVKKYGGDIRVESDKGVGTTFFVSLPRSGTV